MASMSDEPHDEISKLMRRRGAETSWLTRLSRVSTQMQSVEWALMRRRANGQAKPSEPARKSSN